MLDHLHETKQNFRFAGEVRLLVNPLAEIPFCHGVLRPIVHFPESGRQWDGERVQICLSHELAHIIQGDLLMLLTGQLACILCWFNPLVWFAVAKLRSEAERSADDLVLGRNIAPATYAAHLVAITEHCRATALPALGIALAMARPHRLRARIQAILDSTLPRHSPGRVTILAVSLLALGALAMSMMVRLTAAPADPTPTSLETPDPKKLNTQTRYAIGLTVCKAIKAGDTQGIDSLLKRGLDANEDLEYGERLLFQAVDEHQLGVVELLLAHGADVNRKTSWGDTPIKRACWRGYRDIADALIRAGAPVNELQYATGMGDVAGLEAHDRKEFITAKDARSALYFAVASGHENTLDWLWTKLGPLDEPQKDKLLGDLYENAGKWGQAGMLRHLQGLGASPAKFGGKALINAVNWNFVDAARYLLEQGVSLTDRPPNSVNVLRDPAGEGYLEMCRLLLDHNADINAGDPHDFTPLGWAAYCGKEDVCLLLLERGADGGIEDYAGRNAAWHAAGGEHCPRALEWMLKRSVKVTGKDKRGETIFNYMMNFAPPRPGKVAFLSRVYSASEAEAYDVREQRVVELLAGAGVDCKGQEGSETPLMSAFEAGHLAAARTLLRLGADFSTKDKDGNNAVYYMIDRSWGGPLPLDLLENFLAHGGDPNFEVHFPGTQPPASCPILMVALNAAAVAGPDLDGFRQAAQMLIAHGARFTRAADEKAQALLQAAVAGSVPRVQEAVRSGAPVNAAGGGNWDALTISVALDYVDGANWLLAHGAVPSNQEVEPWSNLLDFAAEHGRTDLVEALVSRGAKSKGGIGLDTAIAQGNLRVFEALLKAGADPKSGGNATESIDGKTYTLHDSVPLYHCIDRRQTIMAKTLLDCGADPDPKNLEYNRSLAWYAVDGDCPEILQALLDHGADPARKGDGGDSALSLARKSHPGMVPMLEAAAKRAQKTPPFLAVKISLTEHLAEGDKTLARPTLYLESGKQGIVQSGRFEYNVTPTLLEDGTVDVGVTVTERNGEKAHPLAEQRTKAKIGQAAEVRIDGITVHAETSLVTAGQVREIREAQERPAAPAASPGTAAREEDRAAEARDRAALDHKVESIIVPVADFQATPLSNALEFLRQEAARLDTAEPDPRQRGVNIFLKLATHPKPVAAASPNGGASPATGPSPGTGGTVGTPEMKTTDKPITLTMRQRPLLEVLQAVAQQVDLKVKVERYAVSLVPLSEQTEPLQTVVFIVAPDVLGVSATPSSAAAGEHTASTPRMDAVSWLKEKGVTFPVGTSATYLPGSQKLVVRNTEENINRLKVLFSPPPDQTK